MGDYAAGLFGDAGWPAFRFFADDNAGHMFGRLPVGPAIRWLEVMASDDPEGPARLRRAPLEGGGPARRDRRGRATAKGLKLDAQAEGAARRLIEEIDAAGRPRRRRTSSRRSATNEDNSWVDGFLAFRDDFEFADAAADAMAAFDALRAEHDRARPEAHGRGPRPLPAGQARRGIREGQGGRRQVLRGPVLSRREERRWPRGNSREEKVTRMDSA